MNNLKKLVLISVTFILFFHNSLAKPWDKSNLNQSADSQKTDPVTQSKTEKIKKIKSTKKERHDSSKNRKSVNQNHSALQNSDSKSSQQTPQGRNADPSTNSNASQNSQPQSNGSPVKTNDTQLKQPSMETRSEPPIANKFNPFVMANVGFLRIDGVDNFDGSKLSVVSRIDALVSLGLAFKLSEKFFLFPFGTVRGLTMNPPDNFAFDHPSYLFFGYGLGAKYIFDEDSSISLRISREQEFFIKGVRVNELTLNSAFVYKISPTYFYKITEIWGGNLVAQFSPMYFLKNSVETYHSKDGYGGKVGLILNKSISKTYLSELGLSYGYTVKNTEIINQTNQEVLFTFGITRNF